MERMQENKLWK